MTKKKSLRNCVDLSELIMGMVSKVFFYAQQESKVKKCKSVLQADRTIPRFQVAGYGYHGTV